MSEKKKAPRPPSNKPFKLFWYYLKEDEGPIGWILNIVVAFLIIKYILIPGIGWALGTPFPLVAVVSGSMEHHGEFDTWWDSTCTSNGQKHIQKELYTQESISKEQFTQFRFDNGLNTGDLMILQAPKNILIGDTIVFNANTKYDPIIHRVVNIKDNEGSIFYKTKGDNNCGSSSFEQQTPENRVVGKAWIRIPLLGYVKLYFEKTLRFVGLESLIAVFR